MWLLCKWGITCFPDGMCNHKVGYKEMKAGFHKPLADTQCWSQPSQPGLWSLSVWSGGGSAGTLCPAFSAHSPFPVGAVVWPLSEEPCKAPKPISQSSFCSGSWLPPKPRSPPSELHSCRGDAMSYFPWAFRAAIQLNCAGVSFRQACWWWLQGAHPPLCLADSPLEPAGQPIASVLDVLLVLVRDLTPCILAGTTAECTFPSCAELGCYCPPSLP